MYLAQKIIGRQAHYFIRETYQDGEYLKSRHLFSLGTDPSEYIIYPGGVGYYFDDVVENALRKHGLNPTQDDLDIIFYEFLDPEIQRVIQGFERKTEKQSSATDPAPPVYHLFDMRRFHFLKFGSLNQQQIHGMPANFFRILSGKSRDEIEQHFITAERILHARELLRYLATIFGLQSHLVGFSPDPTAAAKHWHRLDTLFIENVCALNDDGSFWAGMRRNKGLQEYLRRYVMLYFDHTAQWATPIPQYLHEFMNRHRVYQPPQKVKHNMKESARLFETTWANLKKMNRKSFTRLYRKQALKLHPDQGGSQNTFIKLTQLYEKLLKKKDRM
jgi:hypothetical protein